MGEQKKINAHGGKRTGAGRKTGSGRYGEKTTVIRIPESKAREIRLTLLELSNYKSSGGRGTTVTHVYQPVPSKNSNLTLYSSRVSAGLPSLVEDHTDEEIDLNSFLLKNPNTTFFVRVSGDSMIDAGIHPGDLLVVDRSLAPSNGRIVIAVVDGETTVKRLIRENNRLYLMPENPSYPCIEINQETMFMIWGVVTNVIHSLT